MNKIVFICPYFGKLPNYFDLVLESCKYNDTIDWIIFTDDKTKYNYPSNVKVYYMSFEQMKKYIQDKIPFKIKLKKPYKLCDYKPLYGYIFRSYIKKYDFWGHCDLDCIFGRIREFLTDDIFDNYDRILCLGHMSLYNTNLYNIMDSELLNNKFIKIILNNNDKAYYFDESGINIILKKYNKKTYVKRDIIADIYCLSKPFRIIQSSFDDNVSELENKMISKIKNEKNIFEFKDGIISGYYINNNNIEKKEYVYIHLQKRPMNKKTNVINKYLIVPNEFINWKNINIEDIKKYTKRKIFYKQYFKIRFNNLKKKLKNIIVIFNKNK